MAFASSTMDISGYKSSASSYKPYPIYFMYLLQCHKNRSCKVIVFVKILYIFKFEGSDLKFMENKLIIK